MGYASFVCPACHAALTEGEPSWQCTACGFVFPLCGPGLPVLVVDGAAELVARAYAGLRRSGRRLLASADVLEGDEWPREREHLRTRLAAATRANGQFFARLAGSLAPFVRLDAALDAIETTTGAREAVAEMYFDVVRFVARDWSGDGASEREVAALESPLADAVASLGAVEGQSALVLGAGAGRVARDLTYSFGRVLAVDLSVPMPLAFRALAGGPIALYDLDTTNLERADDFARPSAASLESGAREGPAGELRYAVADASELPLADGSVTLIASVFFTDVMRFTLLAPEIDRVLAPGGAFVHIGPLKYHDDDVREHLAVDELVANFGRRGFDIGPLRWVEVFHTDADGRVAKRLYRCPSFTATKRPGGAAAGAATRRLDTHAVPSLEGALTVVHSERMSPRDGPSSSWLIRAATGVEFAASEAMVAMLRDVDGRRSVDELLTRARAGGGEFDEEGLLDALVGLVQAGALVVR